MFLGEWKWYQVVNNKFIKTKHLLGLDLFLPFLIELVWEHILYLPPSPNEPILEDW